MSNTQNISVTKDDGWKLIVTGPSIGTISAGGSYYFCRADTIPIDDFIGHRVTNASLVSYETTTGFNIYAKGDVTIVVTED